ncbi:MAG: cell division protein FtsZ [Bacteroidota bacterium]|nr:cell division protein FtsZ [Bacteroidota bacterium]
MIQFDIPKDKQNIIKVIGVGGGGGSAVNHMYNQGIRGVDFVICNTDMQAIEASPIQLKLQIGQSLTGGLGAGSNPETGEKAAQESIESIVELLGINTKMIFITAGMGGGTGTGAAPIIAQTAKDMGILTVGIVTTPFKVEGNRRRGFADSGLQRMKDSVDCLLVINNDRIMELHGNQKFSNAFAHANDILTTAAKGIAEIITVTGYINVDFEDVRTVMTNSGVAIMGTAAAEGECRALNAIEAAMTSPLLNNNKIKGAKNILLNITSGTDEALMTEIEEITNYVQREAEITTDIILGLTQDESLGNKISVTIIATGFEPVENKPIEQQWVKRNLVEENNQPNSNNAPQKPILNEEESQFELFDLNAPQPLAEEPVAEHIEEIPQAEIPLHEEEITPAMQEDKERVEKLKQRMVEMRKLSQDIRNPQMVDEMYNVPAYIRKAINLEKVPHSSENNLSRVSLVEEKEEKKHELKQNNSFLHDNVD